MYISDQLLEEICPSTVKLSSQSFFYPSYSSGHVRNKTAVQQQPLHPVQTTMAGTVMMGTVMMAMVITGMVMVEIMVVEARL